MTEAATAINPNVPVGSEPTNNSKANSAITFDDVSDAEDAAKPSKPRVVKDNQKDAKPGATKAKAQASKDSSPFDAAEDGDEAPKAKAEKGEKAEKTERDDPAKGEKQAKAPKHKFKSGDEAYDLSGDAVVAVKVNGAREEVRLQDLVDNFSGKTNWDRKFNELRNERTEFQKQRETIDTLVQNLYQKATSGDPDSAFDFLAEVTKQDAAKLKIGILKKQFEELLPLYEMHPEERERFFKERELDWRDKAHVSRERADSEKQAQVKQEAARKAVSDRYGIDEESYGQVSKMVHSYLKEVDPKFDGKVTPDHVVYAHRKIMAMDVVSKNVPHLEKHGQFGNILEDIVSDLVKHPEMTRDKLAKLLVEVWGGDDEGLRKIARKAARSAQASDDDTPISSKSKNAPLSFDDLED